MKYEWLQQSDTAQTIVIFFSGWGFDTSIVQHLHTDPKTHVLFVTDYRCLNTQLPDLSGYQQRYLVAWSFGVAAYTQWQHQQTSTEKIMFDKTIAINGSRTAVNRKTGIPNAVMQKTIETLSPSSFQVFAEKCFQHSSANANQRYTIDVNARREELEHIQHWQTPETTQHWDKVWISQNDRIFPVRNLQRAWQDHQDQIELIDASHAPFNTWQNWHEIIA